MKMNNKIVLNKWKGLSQRFVVFFVKGQIGFLAITCLFASPVHAAWLDSAWPHRQKVTISGTLATTQALTNFPALVQITDQENPVFSNSFNNGQDIVFTAADGVTRLAHEIDSFHAGLTGAKALNAWVSIPELQPGIENELYMYYGNTWAFNEQDSGAVWAEYVGVWHLNEDQSGLNPSLELYRDSTANGYHGYDYVSTNNVDGCVGKGSSMGGSDYIRFNKELYTTNDFTITAWAKPDQLAWEAIVGDDGSRYFMIWAPSGLIGRSSIAAGVHDATWGTTPVETGLWQHFAFRSTGEEGAIRTFYKNGSQVGSSATPTLSLPLEIDPWTMIGRWGLREEVKYFHGVLDEVRISDKALPSAWLDAEYRNASAPASYVSAGVKEDCVVSSVPWPALTFAYRQEIGVMHGAAQTALTNFPILIAITNSLNPLFSMAAANGGDIMFTAADGVTPLPHEIEQYHPAAPASLYAWVRLPVLHAGRSTRIYMYYGRAGEVNHLESTDVWSEDYLGVWHLSENVTNGQINYDSTATAAHGVFQDPNSRGGGDATGKIAGADAFSGNYDHYVLTPGVQCTTNGFTISAWIRNDADITDYAMYEGGDIGFSYSGINPQKLPLVSVFADNKQSAVADGSTSVVNGRWYYFALVCCPTRLEIYVDGVRKDQVSHKSVESVIRAKYIGRAVFDAYGIHGIVDELRISGVPYSAEWIKACYNSQKEPGANLFFLPPEYNAPNGTLIIVQ